MDTISLAAATILTGLSAGLLCGWRVSVILGTRRTSSHAYVETMQAIDRAILNVFFLVSLGVPVAIAVTTVVLFVDDANARAGLLAFAFLLYLTTTVVTTAVGNIPPNDQLETFDASRATSDEVNAARVGNEHPRNRWHDVRTVSSASALCCVLAAFVDVS